VTTYVAVFALVLAYLATVAAYCALRTLAKLRRDTHLLSRGTRGPKGQQSLIELTTRHAELTATLSEQVEALQARVDTTQREFHAQLDALRQENLTQVDALRQEAVNTVAEQRSSEADALRRVALVRYDAFTEMSGRMSFSLALLDDDGNGIAISAITGRTDTRVYAKPIAAGEGEHGLSPEERQAVAAALAPARKHRKAAPKLPKAG
jgi:hypothetical protein